MRTAHLRDPATARFGKHRERCSDLLYNISFGMYYVATIWVEEIQQVSDNRTRTFKKFRFDRAFVYLSDDRCGL